MNTTIDEALFTEAMSHLNLERRCPLLYQRALKLIQARDERAIDALNECAAAYRSLLEEKPDSLEGIFATLYCLAIEYAKNGTPEALDAARALGREAVDHGRQWLKQRPDDANVKVQVGAAMAYVSML